MDLEPQGVEQRTVAPPVVSRAAAVVGKALRDPAGSACQGGLSITAQAANGKARC